MAVVVAAAAVDAGSTRAAPSVPAATPPDSMTTPMRFLVFVLIADTPPESPLLTPYITEIRYGSAH
jgi:hypothetical protein